MAFGVMLRAPIPFRCCVHPAHFNAFTKEGEPLGTPLEVATRRWNTGDFPFEVGQHDNLAIFGEQETFGDNVYGDRTPVTLTLSLRVEQCLFSARWPLTG